MFRGARPLKRWRYVGVFCEELMACAAVVRVGPLRQSFWAVLTRTDGRLRERTHTLPRRGAVELVPGRPARSTGSESESGRLWVRDGDVLLDLSLDEDEGIQALCPHGREHVWTRKQAGVPARGTLLLGGGSERRIEALAVIDDTAGYHARFTEWWWSAGVGTGEDGVALAWNLVSGINDPPTGSERAVWVDGTPSEPAPVRFAADLSEIVAQDGSRLSFATEAQRRRKENLLILSSDYTAPFGTFSGTLPGGAGFASGLGVMEHHRAHW